MIRLQQVVHVALMITHDTGVTFPESWQLAERDTVRFRVLVVVNKGVSVPDVPGADFVATHKLSVDWSAKWGGVSLAEVPAFAIREIQLLCPKVQKIALVSGSDNAVFQLKGNNIQIFQGCTGTSYMPTMHKHNSKVHKNFVVSLKKCLLGHCTAEDGQQLKLAAEVAQQEKQLSLQATAAPRVLQQAELLQLCRMLAVDSKLLKIHHQWWIMDIKLASIFAEPSTVQLMRQLWLLLQVAISHYHFHKDLGADELVVGGVHAVDRRAEMDTIVSCRPCASVCIDL